MNHNRRSLLIDRRKMLLGASAAALIPDFARAALPNQIPERIAFQIVRQGHIIGDHILELKRDGASLTVQIAVDVVLGIGPIALFRYKLRGTEQWTDGVVSHVDAQTNDDGTKAYIRAERGPEGLWVQGSKAARYLAPDNALPATHWNRAELDGPWINPQDGRLFHPTITKRGDNSVPLAAGGNVIATQYNVAGDVLMDLWYDSTGSWTSLLFKAHDGSDVRYERT